MFNANCVFGPFVVQTFSEGEDQIEESESESYHICIQYRIQE